MSALYELAAEFQAVAAKLEEMDMDEQTIADTLDGYAADFENKVISVVSLIRNLEATGDAIKQAMGKQNERLRAIEKKADWLRDYVVANMVKTNINAVSCGLFSARIRINAPSVQIAENACLPSRFMVEKVTVNPDKKALKEAIEAGETIDGVSLTRSTSLTIK